jgi:hypothetical protein
LDYILRASDSEEDKEMGSPPRQLWLAQQVHVEDEIISRQKPCQIICSTFSDYVDFSGFDEARTFSLIAAYD